MKIFAQNFEKYPEVGLEWMHHCIAYMQQALPEGFNFMEKPV